ncbi:CotH kinase family protein [Paenibacillus paridis]|uniref:CotH kinase family protein n=1 Tax=Paenibacillus paridis TaxID=2583376 RepID=UPI001121FCD8|nr:CotH kinase family protein [Paenibacillus paridis]
MKAKAQVVLLCFCSILLIFGLTGCTIGGTSFGLASTGTTASAGEKSADEQKLDETVFPKDKVVDVKITIDKDDFQNMLDNASAEEYKQASVEYNGQTFDNVAIRTKGNLSLNSVVNMTDSDRYSFKISFDEYVNQTLQGISKINLNNNYSDASYMREFLSYELAEQMGLPTPKFSYVNVYVNDELWGFYLAIEQIGDAYLERNFGNAYGALYKANGGNGSELNWLETIDAYTGLDLKSDKSNDDILLDMVDELNNGTDYESVLDVDEALKFIALNAVAGNFDSYLSEKKHNYYLYENDGLFNILPWDYNMSFGGFGGSGVLIDEPTTGTLADRPLIDKLLKVDAYKEKYHEIVTDMLEGYLADETFQARIAEIKELISPYVKADPSSFYTYEQYEQGVTQVISFNATQTSSIAQQLAGTIPSSGDGSGSGSSGFGGGGRGGGGMGGGGFGGNRQNPQQNAQPNNGQNTQPTDGAAPNAAPAAKTDNTQAAAAAVDEQADQASAGAKANSGISPTAKQADFNGNVNTSAIETAVDTDVNDSQGTPPAAGSAPNGNTAESGQGAAGTAVPNGQAPQEDGGITPPDGQMPDQQGGGMAPPDGQMPNQQGGGMQGGFGGGQPPDGQGGFGGGMGGMGGGGFGGPGTANAQPQGSPKEAATAGIAIAILLLSCAFVVYYKRKRL